LELAGLADPKKKN
jgi:hypothetical protein